MGRLACRLAFATALGTTLLGAPAAKAEPTEPSGAAAPDAPTSTPSPPPPPRRPDPAGRDLVRALPTIAIVDGAWSIALQLGTSLVTHTWAGPYPRGVIAQQFTRALYGGSWTLMLGLEAVAVLVASGAKFDWLAEAAWRTDWIFGLSVPACPRPGAFGGCGIGVGGFGGVHLRPVGTHWWFEASGGWIEQRVATDQRRTLAESAWVLTPFASTYEVRAGAVPVALRARAGPGVYFGMHNAHLHPTELGTETLDVSLHELYALDYGVGPGLRAEARVVFFDHVSIDGEAVVAPLLAGGSSAHPSTDLAPLERPSEALPTWRSVALGASVEARRVMPMRLGLAFYGAELSGRSLSHFGHEGVMLRFEFPMRVADAER